MHWITLLCLIAGPYKYRVSQKIIQNDIQIYTEKPHPSPFLLRFAHLFFTKGKCFSHTPVVFLCSWPTTGAMDSMPTAGSTKRFMGWGVPKSTNWKMQSRWVKNYSFPMVLVARTWFTMMWQWITINEDKKKYCRELQENGGSTADLRNSDTPRSQGQLD